MLIQFYRCLSSSHWPSITHKHTHERTHAQMIDSPHQIFQLVLCKWYDIYEMECCFARSIPASSTIKSVDLKWNPLWVVELHSALIRNNNKKWLNKNEGSANRLHRRRVTKKTTTTGTTHKRIAIMLTLEVLLWLWRQPEVVLCVWMREAWKSAAPFYALSKD